MKAKKRFPIFLSVLVIASIASTAVLGNSHVAYAGGGLCIKDPNPVELTLAQGESQTIDIQVSDCGFDIDMVVINNADDCTSQGVDVSIQTTSSINGLLFGEETITNIGGNPGTTTCVIVLRVITPAGGADVLDQTIMVTTSEPVVGGKLLPIESTALLLSGVQTNATWLIPVVLSIVGIGLVLVKRK